MKKLETRKTLQILIATIIVVTFVPHASAEVQDQVIVPFEFLERLCGLNENGTKYICEWDPFSDVDIEDVLENGTSNIPDVAEVKTVNNATSTDSSGDIMKEPRNQFERDLLRFQNDPPSSASESDYYNLLQELGVCWHGINETRGVQTYDEYIVSLIKKNPSLAYLQSLEYKGAYADLKKAVQECLAIRTILRPITLGPEYMVRGEFFGINQPYHAELAKVDPKPVGDRKIDLLEDKDVLDNEANDAKRDHICKSSMYPHSFKKQMGCISNNAGTPGFVNMPFSEAYHKWYHYTIADHQVNTSRPDYRVPGEGPIDTFIKKHGGYEEAIKAIKLKKHLDTKDPEVAGQSIE